LVEDVLSDVEEEVLQIIKTVSLEGHNVLEPLVEFEDFNKSAELQSSLPSHEQTFTVSPRNGILVPLTRGRGQKCNTLNFYNDHNKQQSL
jgi:hypothetical protein